MQSVARRNSAYGTVIWPSFLSAKGPQPKARTETGRFPEKDSGRDELRRVLQKNGTDALHSIPVRKSPAVHHLGQTGTGHDPTEGEPDGCVWGFGEIKRLHRERRQAVKHG